ncbi:NAD(P)-dependent oxidoreductase [Phreatobacter stygius]|uniref:Hydroxyacid dehydrogenase n=1 Tax=Phreatobacter stygius TaxID=1940610 RepID=A0A4D7AW55_9HYPH|nr:NAD(P)-dependent oxidoreductase [Phreatobacter stygius]QCI64131.1 hydroxyacid dehydrogenase [Phreatobacter stygius]
MTAKRVFLTHTPDMLANYYGPRAVAALREMAEVVINPTGQVLDAEGLAKAAAGAAIIVSDRLTPGYGAFFKSAPDLVAFLRCAVDIRNVDVAAASREGVLVTRATPGFIASVAELGFGMMIDLARGVSRAVGSYRAGAAPVPRMGRQLSGSTIGIIGYGAIGQHMAGLGKAFGMRVLASDPYKTIDEDGIEQVSFEALLAEADFVICLVVATEATENLMNAAAFARMKPGACFVNLSRGNLVDEAALAAALDAGRLTGAAMDVGRAPDQMPSPALAGRPDVVATPHTGGLTPAAIEHQAFDTVGQVRALLSGAVPPGAVNTEAATRLGRLKGGAS